MTKKELAKLVRYQREYLPPAHEDALPPVDCQDLPDHLEVFYRDLHKACNPGRLERWADDRVVYDILQAMLQAADD